ncbi:MAG: DUF4268 domain-containing protein [Ferruginibacter sp.]
MYTQQEASALRQKFWISFGKYMSPIPSSTGEKTNWINYRTGIKFINFKMDATEETASIAIEISHNDIAMQELYFNHFKTFKKALEEILAEKWEWQLNAVDENGNPIARIYANLANVNIHNEHDWPKIITFFKNRIIKLDNFWNEYRDIFDMLT